jgi:hypothetical protein
LSIMIENKRKGGLRPAWGRELPVRVAQTPPFQTAYYANQRAARIV